MKKFSPEIKEVALLFLKFGTTAFGGPAAHISMMQDEVVRKRSWLTQNEFLDMLSATNFIPGPNSTEMAIHIGYRRAGYTGLILAGTLFILPAALIVSIIAHFYLRYGNLPSVQNAFNGIKPVIIAIILQALAHLGKSALKNNFLILIFILSALANAFGLSELVVLGLAGTITFCIETRINKKSVTPVLMALFSLNIARAAAVTAIVVVAAKFSLSSLFLFFLKVGSVLFGSGYVLLAFLRSDLVDKLHWLSDQQLLDATAVGQFTPGPVFTTATFIGYLISGPLGAIVATLGIFLPSFIFVAISAPFIGRLRNSPTLASILNGVNVASLALMLVVAWQLSKSSITNGATGLISILSLFILLRFRVNSAWLVFAGGLVGVLLKI